MSSGTGSFWQVDPATATATFIGDLGVKITGLAAHGNVLYGTGSQGNNNLYTIDTATGATTLVGAYGNSAPYITTISIAFDAAGNLHAILDFNPQPSGSTIIQWNDLAQVTADVRRIGRYGKHYRVRQFGRGSGVRRDERVGDLA